MIYRDIYSWWLFDEIKTGKTVYALDRRLNVVYSVNSRTVDELVAIMKSADEEPHRYVFWCEETEETEKVTEETEEKENA